MGEQSFFQTAQEYQGKLQSFSRVQRHERDLGALVVGISVTNQRSMIEELIQCFSPIARIHGRVHQFAQIFNARICFRSVFFLELLDVAGAVDEKFQNLRSVCARSVVSPGV